MSATGVTRAQAESWLPPIQLAEKPPPTDNSTPFTKLASPEARNSAFPQDDPYFPCEISDFEHLPRVLVESLGIRCVDLVWAQHVHPSKKRHVHWTNFRKDLHELFAVEAPWKLSPGTTPSRDQADASQQA
jgi:hypothetical protein